MRDVILMPTAELQPGNMRQFEFGEQKVLVCNIGGELHAVDGVCPHRGALLAQGHLHTNGVVVCPWHGWAFDCTTGEGLTNPTVRLRQYQLREEDGNLVVRIP